MQALETLRWKVHVGTESALRCFRDSQSGVVINEITASKDEQHLSCLQPGSLRPCRTLTSSDEGNKGKAK